MKNVYEVQYFLDSEKGTGISKTYLTGDSENEAKEKFYQKGYYGRVAGVKLIGTQPVIK